MKKDVKEKDRLVCGMKTRVNKNKNKRVLLYLDRGGLDSLTSHPETFLLEGDRVGGGEGDRVR